MPRAVPRLVREYIPRADKRRPQITVKSSVVFLVATLSMRDSYFTPSSANRFLSGLPVNLWLISHRNDIIIVGRDDSSAKSRFSWR